jgi:hypothetical protein
MNNDKNSIIVYNSQTTLNELTAMKSSSIISEIKRNSSSSKYDKEKNFLKRTKTITIKPKTVVAEPGNNNTSRTDVYGNIIVKNEKVKSYKVTFRDKTLNKPLTEIIEVTSYKKYYNDDDKNQDKETGVKCGCGCIIF